MLSLSGRCWGADTKSRERNEDEASGDEQEASAICNIRKQDYRSRQQASAAETSPSA